MAMLKLPSDIQSLFCASTQICSYKRAVEELVYNSLDAESTSIAVRVNIEQNTIQVIDNGCGVSKCNFSLIGQRHATSKCVDLSTLKSIPNKYGYRGQSLASIIEVSQSVKVTSRCHDSEETWIKTFHEGKEQKLCAGDQRPSKGTTIDIKGFLYNLKIQKKAIDSLNELNEIKAFLEQLSLVHNNISLSLRDDAKNEIIFQLHKNRDIYQTLRSMFEIGRSDFQELKVEKNNYKVSAFIGKTDKELSSKHWIYLNGKYLQSKKFQKIVNDNLKKTLKLNQQNRKKVKSKNPHNHEDDSHQKCIPYYFIFITCPYYDYDINQVSKQTVVEFKDWELINKLIEKMAKLYAGDINMKEIRPVKNQVVDQQKTDDTRDQVKKIMHKILGSHSRRIGVSQMQNGIKGKITKRKPKNNSTKILNLKDKRVGSKRENQITNRKEKSKQEIPEEIRITSKEAKPPKVYVGNIKEKKVTAQKIIIPRESVKANHNNKDKVCENNNNKTNYIRMKPHETTKKKHEIATNLDDTCKKNKLPQNFIQNTIKANTEHLHKSKMASKNKNNSKKTEKTKKRTDRKKFDKPKLKTKNFINYFAHDPRGSVKRRCNILANKIDDLMSYKKKRKRKIFINETVQYSNIIKDNKNYSIRKKIDEIVIHDYIPKPPTYIPCTFDDRVWDKIQKERYNSSYDLMKTILRTQETRNSCREILDVEENDNKIKPLENVTIDDDDISTRNHDNIFETAYEDPIDDSRNISLLPRLTFESHNYVKHCNQISHNYNIQSYACEKPKEKLMDSRFITKQSKENFVIPTIKPKKIKKRPAVVKLNNIEFQSNNLHKFTKQVESHQESSYKIEFSKSNDKATASRSIDLPSHLNETQIENGTYTIGENYKINDEIYLEVGSTYTINNTYHENGSKGAESIDYIEDSTEKLVHGHLSKNDLKLKNEANGNCNGYFIHKNNNHEDCTLRVNEENVDYMGNSINNAVQSQLNPNDILFDNENFDLKNRQPKPQNPELKMNVVFISRSQEKGKSKDVEIQTTIDKQINPLNFCETVHSQDNDQQNTSHIEWNDSLFNADFELDPFLCDRDAYTLRDCESIDANEINVNTSSKVTVWNKTALENVSKSVIGGENSLNSAYEFNETTIYKREDPVNVMKKDQQNIIERNSVQKDSNHFNFKHRLRFVPKGMSQIFTKCQSRYMSDYNPRKDYYEEAIYNDFANNVQMNCEILEPGVQSVKELTTKAIDKVNYKLNKDNASLIFNGESLKQAKVLKQIDNKFIAAKITGRSHHSLEITEYLVLFDQHAVHERIRLETNLSEYFNGNEWKSMPLDDVKLKVSKDEILYLHNYRNKFTQLGLQWTVLRNGEVAIDAIPLAILGKNPRQVEIVIKAVRSLIVEEINAIKSQSGCISLYPKAIMDLVFSESCRYAIKFGDHLSKDECVDLLRSLSECKTPFQCAHGRPVMAVLMDIKADIKKYTINMESIQKWKRMKKQPK